uniref:Uncharacterized protein n=1 Tax=Sciurus vulgaris TaxID=55149 RepID=A0A8D2APH2_SCIVU
MSVLIVIKRLRSAKFSPPQIIRPPASLQRRRFALHSRTAPGREGESSDSQGKAGPPRPRHHHRSLLTDDDAQVLEAGQRVLLGVQHLLGGLLHVPVRLLGEHSAAAAASRLLPREGQGGHLHPPRAAAPRHLRLRLQYGGSPLRALHRTRETRASRPPPPPASSGRRSPPQARPLPGTQSHGGGALGSSSTTPLSLRPPLG